MLVAETAVQFSAATSCLESFAASKSVVTEAQLEAEAEPEEESSFGREDCKERDLSISLFATCFSSSLFCGSEFRWQAWCFRSSTRVS